MLEEIKEFLQDFEAHLVVYAMKGGAINEEESFRSCILKLAVKCSSLLQVSLSLLSKDFVSESEATSRIFQETCTYLQHFIVYQGKGSKFVKWKENPEKPLKESDEKLRKEVDEYWHARFKTSGSEDFWRSNFKFLSNISVHPTFRCIKLSFSDALRRHQGSIIEESNEELEKSWKRLSDQQTDIFCMETSFYLNFFIEQVWNVLEMEKSGYNKEKMANFITKLDDYIELRRSGSIPDLERE